MERCKDCGGYGCDYCNNTGETPTFSESTETVGCVQIDYESKLRALLNGLRAHDIENLLSKDDEYFFVLGGNIAQAVRRGTSY